jgi:hypothetical protein
MGSRKIGTVNLRMMKFGTLIDVQGPGRASTNPGFSIVGVPSGRRSGAGLCRAGFFAWTSLHSRVRSPPLRRFDCSGHWLVGRVPCPSAGDESEAGGEGLSEAGGEGGAEPGGGGVSEGGPESAGGGGVSEGGPGSAGGGGVSEGGSESAGGGVSEDAESAGGGSSIGSSERGVPGSGSASATCPD